MATIYTQINSHTLLCFYQPYCILLLTDSPLIIPFPGLSSNINPVFSVRSVITAKKNPMRNKQGIIFADRIKSATKKISTTIEKRESKH